MFDLKKGYFVSGIIIGLYLLVSFFTSLPDKKLHIVFCNIGQGDGTYIRFPDGRDMVVDGGPSSSGMVACLGRHMPFWDRTIDIVMLSHPQKDHMQGLIEVVNRYHIRNFVQSDIQNNTDGYRTVINTINEKHVPRRFVTSGETITIGETMLDVVWPSVSQLAAMKCSSCNKDVLGAVSDGDLNNGAIVFWLDYQSFNALFTADADIQVSDAYVGSSLPDTSIELLKVPHHGSKTGMDASFLQWLKPRVAVISVGKNTFGHPTNEAMQLLESVGSTIFRTDIHGDIRVVSDGATWQVY